MKCEHPLGRKPGTCARSAIGEFTVPDSYTPRKRHVGQPDVPRPHAHLCRQHGAKVEAHGAGEEIAANGHEAQCAICQHPRREQIERLWVSWILSTGDVLREFDLAQSTFYHHVNQFDLWKQKASKVNTKRALVLAAERGFDSGGHNAATALRALRLLAQERGDADRVDVEFRATDLSRLTDEELLAAEEIARKVRVDEDDA